MMTGAPFHRCVECNEIITTPICSDCLAGQMREVLAEQDPSLAAAIAGAAIEGDTVCILCGRSMGLCAYCFSRDMYVLVQHWNPALAAEFAARFDFDLRHNVVV